MRTVPTRRSAREVPTRGTNRGASGARVAERPAERDGARPRRRDAEVLAAATKVFHERSYADSSVQDVADELGILKGSLYHYIKTKEDLLVWLLEDVQEDLDQILDDICDEDQLDPQAPLDQLARYVREQALYVARNVARVTVYDRDANQLSPGPRKALRQRRRAREQRVVEMIAEAQRRGEVPEHFEAQVLADTVSAVLTGIVRWYRPNGPVKRDQLADLCVEFALCGTVGAGAAT